MVSGGPPAPSHGTAHSLHHALGNLGGRQKSWMMLPGQGPASPAQLRPQPSANPMPPAKRGRGRPRKTPVDNHPPTRTVDAVISSASAHQPEHQQPFISSSLQLPNTTSLVTTTAPAQGLASWPANSDHVHVTTNVLASTHIQSTGASETSAEQVELDSVHPERVTQNSTDGQAQQSLIRPDPPPQNPVQASRPAFQPAWYTRQECLDALQRFQSSIPTSSTHTSDRVRMVVLRDAVDKQDWAYLTMHQIYCMLTTYPGNISVDLKNSPALPYALNILHDVLTSNQTLSPTVLYFFSNFPYPLETLRATWGPTFQQQMHLFTLFVSRSPNYEQLRQICDQRRYPPLAQELGVTLGIASITFQRIVFTSLLRYIWRSIPPNPILQRFEAQALAVLQQNQRTHPRLQLESVSVPSQEEVIMNQAYSLKLREIVQQCAVASRESGLTSVSPYQQLSPYQSQGSSMLRPSSNGQMNHLPVQPAVHRIHGSDRPPPAPTDLNTLLQPADIPASSPAQSHKKPKRFLLPPSGYKQPQQRVPNPSRYSLHQADLRSPILCAPSGSPPLYTFQKGFIRPPTRLSEPGRTIETWKFNMTREEIRVFCKTAHQTTGAPGTRDIDENSKLANLRCIKWKQGEEMPKEEVWATAETSWIPYFYISLNDTSLKARKKLHHGKDLPIDVTDLLQEGENVLKMTVMSESGDTSHLNHLIAIEAICIAGHASIKQLCLDQGRVSAEEILQGIKDKLSGSGDDDEISIVQSNMTIGLREPFSQARMCDIPVRSRACLHNDCFDLDIFLQSRARKGDASVADQWKCPICSVDARPHMLFHDGFIELVKQQLEVQGLIDTRHIIVQQDGSWKPKPEAAAEDSVVREGSAAKQTPPVSARASAPRIPPAVEVIDLSD